MKHGSLFSGIGGFDLGFQRAGIETAWQVELDPYCRRVLARHFPNAERFADVHECRGRYSKIGWGKHRLVAVDVISGGFPCQPTSCAGSRKGDGDPRWLWPEMFRIICEVRPKFVVAENTDDLLFHEGGRLIDKIYSQLETESYETLPPIVLPACAFGAPQRRDRVWIVAHSNGTRIAQPQGREHEEWGRALNSGQAVADAECDGRQQGSEILCPRESLAADGGENVPNSQSQRCNGRSRVQEAAESRGRIPIKGSHPWIIEPNVGRVANGVPARVDRLRGLGNAIVPQIAEFIGRRILDAS